VICLHCGYCCLQSLVVVVNDPAKGPVEGNLIVVSPTTPCPHLRGKVVGEYSCAVHSKRWYKKTPCYSHGQIEQGNTECRMGRYLVDLKTGTRKKSKRL
jgi:hypothetical protein